MSGRGIISPLHLELGMSLGESHPATFLVQEYLNWPTPSTVHENNYKH